MNRPLLIYDGDCSFCKRWTARWQHLTAAAIESCFKPLGVGAVTRYEVPNLEALNFALPDILAGGGSRSLRIDSQGKTLGMALLALQINPPKF